MLEGILDDMFMFIVIYGIFGLYLFVCYSVFYIICICMVGYLILYWFYFRKYYRLCEFVC